MPRVITGIDHVGLVSHDMAETEAVFRRLGFAVTAPVPLLGTGPDGKPRPLGQDSQHIVFRDSYVELTAITDPAAGNHLAPFIARYAGLHIVALATASAADAAAELATRGIAAGPVMEASRHVAYGTPGLARFRWLMVPPATAPEGLFCVVEHVTPETVYQEAVTAHPNSALGVSEIMVCVEDVGVTTARYQQMLAAPCTPVRGGRAFDFGEARLVVLEADGIAGRYTDVRPPSLPWLAGFIVTVADIGHADALLRANGVGAIQTGPDRLWVHPEEAAGAIIEFRATE